MKIQEEINIQEESEQLSQSKSKHQSPESLQKKKKIKKHKKQSRLAADFNRNQTPIISQFMQQRKIYFQNSRQALTELYRQLVSTADIVSMIKQEKSIFHLKQNDCQSETWRHIQLIKVLKQSMYDKIQVGCNSNAFAVSILRSFKNYEEQKLQYKNVRFLSSNEDYLFRAREVARHWCAQKIQLIAKQLGYKDSQIQLIEPHTQMIALFKINKQVQRETLRLVYSYLSREDSLYNCHIEDRETYSLQLQNIYLRAIIIKNFQKGFDQTPIDFYNYHKTIEIYEQNSFVHEQFERIKNLAQFQKYLEIRKPRGKSKDKERKGKQRKYQKNHLRTPCSACFSDFSQLSNPIQKCPECQNRAHKSCQNVNRCHRCRYCRTSKKQRQQTGFCYICDRESQKGLMILTVTNSSPHYYAHSFCLLAHNLWRVEDKEFKGKFIKTNQNPIPCKFCNKTKGILFDCECCDGKVHAMCAYLSGLSFRMEKHQIEQQTNYSIFINCCISETRRERLSFERKFKLNYEKVVFRRERKFKESEELYEYIERNRMEQMES